jgi:hypothetical protein
MFAGVAETACMVPSPSRRGLDPVALALLVLLAGCGGLSFAPDRTPTSDADAEAPADPPDYPPGLSDEGVTGPHALSEAHADSLSNVSFESTMSTTVTDANGTVVRETEWTLRRESDADGYHFVGTRRESGLGPAERGRLNFSQWTDGEVTATRVVDEDATRYQFVRERRRPPVSLHGDVYGRLVAIETRTTGFTRDDGALFHVLGTRFTRNDSVPPLYDEASLTSFSMGVEPDGTIRYYRLEFEALLDGRNVTVTADYRVERTGGVDVSRPPWVATAAERANDTEV